MIFHSFFMLHTISISQLPRQYNCKKFTVEVARNGYFNAFWHITAICASYVTVQYVEKVLLLLKFRILLELSVLEREKNLLSIVVNVRYW